MHGPLNNGHGPIPHDARGSYILRREFREDTVPIASTRPYIAGRWTDAFFRSMEHKGNPINTRRWNAYRGDITKPTINAFLVTMVLMTSSILLVSAAGQDGTDPVDPNLVGQVVEAGTEKGLVATITFWGAETNEIAFTVQTGEEGGFSLTVHGSVYEWSASAEGYETASGRFEMPLEGVKRLVIELSPISVVEKEDNIVGMVNDAGTGVGIHAYIAIMGREGTVIARAETLRDGSFSILVRPGSYLWSAESKGYVPQKGEVAVPEEGATRLIIEMEQQQTEEQYGAIVGKVVSMEGGALPDVIITAWPMSKEVPLADGTMPPGAENGMYPYPYPEPITAITGPEGMFEMRVPFGGFELMAEKEGYMPTSISVWVTPEQPKALVSFELETLPDPEPYPDMGSIRTRFNMIDANSDGTPERIDLLVFLDDDEVPEIEFHMVDENSDGNPEETSFMMDVPTGDAQYLLSLIMMLLQTQMYMPQTDYSDTDWSEVEWPEEGSGTTSDGEEQFDPSVIEEWLKNLGGDEEADGSEVDGTEGTEVTEKGGSNDERPDYVLGAFAIAAMLLLISLLVIMSFMVRKRRRY